MEDRYCLMERRSLSESIKRAQRDLDKIGVNLNISKELRHQCPEVLFKRADKVFDKYSRRCNLQFLKDIVNEILREYLVDSAVHLFESRFKVVGNSVVIIPMFYLSEVRKVCQKGTLFIIEINTESAAHCVSVAVADNYYVISDDLCVNGKYLVGIQLVYDIVTKDVYELISDDNMSIDGCVKLSLPGSDVRAMPLGKDWAKIVSNYKVNGIELCEITEVTAEALSVLHDYALTLKDMNTYRKPSTVYKHRSNRVQHDTVVIERAGDVSRKVRDVYIKMSDMIKERTGHREGTPHSSHASPCEHTRRATMRHLKDGRIVPVRGSVVNAGKGNKAVKTIIVDR